MNRILFLDSVAGVAGDMFAAAFVDAGIVTAAELQGIPAALGFSGVEVQCSSVIRATMRATHVNVVADKAQYGSLSHSHEPQPEQHLHVHDPGHAHAPHAHDHAHGEHAHEHGHGEHSHGHHHGEDAHGHQHGHGDPDHAEHEHTHYSDIDHLLRKSQLEEPVRELARKVFRLIAESEAAAHGMKVEDVAFHEVGSIDSIVDVTLAAYCVTKANAATIFATPIRPGRGLIKMAHGTHPVPPPASARLLIGMPVAGTPAAITRENVELSTPTGIAILKALAPRFVSEVPAGVVKQYGLGAGTMNLGVYPNVFRVLLLDSDSAPVSEYEADRVVEVACNIDDDTSEHIAWLAERLLANGALDVTLLPATGKKGRPTTILSVLCAEQDWRQHAEWLLANSTTFGVRYHAWDRFKLARRFEQRNVGSGTVQFKIGLTTSGRVIKEKPEFEDVKREWAQKEKGR